MSWRTCSSVLAVCGSLLASEVRAESFPGLDAVTCDETATASPSTGEIPANVARFVVSRSPGANLIRVSTGEIVETTRHFSASGLLLRPRAPLAIGEQYEIARYDCPTGTPSLAEYTVVAPIDPPVVLGTLSAGQLRAYYRRPGTREIYYFADVSLIPDPSMTPWLDAYDWWLEDGSHASSPRALRDGLTSQIDIRCARGVRTNAHVTGYAQIVPGAVDLGTPELIHTYECDDAILIDPATGEPLTPEEIEELERLADTDAYVVDIDASAPDAWASSIDGGSATMPTEPDTNGNCGASPSRASSPMWLLLSIFGMLLVRRRHSTRASER